MPGRKKDPSTRARRNKAATKATLVRDDVAAQSRDELEAMNVISLRAAIDEANLVRPADAQISKRGSKASMVDALIAAASKVPLLPPHPPRIVRTFDDAGELVESKHPVEWHAQTLSWWADAWTSPMEAQWDSSDLHNMTALALVYDDIWSADTAKARKDAMSEYRLQRADLGLSPLARRRLEWSIETAEEAKERGRQRRGNGSTPRPPAQQPTPGTDPRAHLAVVS